jgi:hypothetical protein
MRRPQDLGRDALVDIVDALQQAIYLEARGGQLVWNPDKEWEAADALMELAGLLSRHGLAPRRVQPWNHEKPCDGPH